MLRWMRVHNIAVIDHLEVKFERGLNLLTGETGAGKSILVDALGLVLGSRATAELIRSGAENAHVEAGFDLEPFPELLRLRLEGAGIDVESGEVVVRREFSASGRARVAVNGCAGATSLLRDMAAFLADIHGQGENLGLARPGAALELLDTLAGILALRRQVGDAYRQWFELGRELARLERESRDQEARKELLDFQLREIEAARLEPGEDEKLEEERKLLIHEERLRKAAEEAFAVLYEEENSVLTRLSQVRRRVSELAEIDPRLQPFLESQSTISTQLEEMALFLRDYREKIRFSPGRLDEVEERLAALERLKKKYGGSLGAVQKHLEGCREALLLLETSGDKVKKLSGDMERAIRRYLETARELSQLRIQTADTLERRVEKELRGLAMEKARFAIALRSVEDEGPSSEWRETGLDEVELLFSANPGEELRALSRVASGGETSRFMLALKSVAAKAEPPKTFVFDEIDSGIEGRVADVVGEKLKELSRTHQVVCVTHLPQIASFADVHYRIEKVVSRGRAVTRVERLDREGRVNEIARMIAGAVITESARRHAEQLVIDKS